MNLKEQIGEFWKDIAEQNAENLKKYFTAQARIRWHNTNECFGVGEFIRANCEYPGAWNSEVERVEQTEHGAVTVARVWLLDGSISFHVTSFLVLEGDKIKEADEYWSEDGEAPQWRQELHIGKKVRSM